MLTGKELGAAIKHAIEKKGVTQKAVAAHFGIRPPYQALPHRTLNSPEDHFEVWAEIPDGGNATCRTTVSRGYGDPARRGGLTVLIGSKKGHAAQAERLNRARNSGKTPL